MVEALSGQNGGWWTRWAVGVVGGGRVGRSEWQGMDALDCRCGGWWTRWVVEVAGGGRVGRSEWQGLDARKFRNPKDARSRFFRCAESDV